MKSFYAILSVIIFHSLLSCQSDIEQTGEIEKFSQSKPYAINISSERSYFQASKVAQRINDMGIHSYIIQFSDTLNNSGHWFQIMCGAIENQDSARNLKTYLAEIFHLSDAKIVNYQDYADTEFRIDTTKLNELRRIGSERPDIPDRILQVVKKFPESNSLYVKDLSVINSPNDPDRETIISVVYNLKLDLPRGISRKKLLEETSCFAEVVYRDNLYGDKVIIDIGKLRKTELQIQKASFFNRESNKQVEIAGEYAELVLNTGEYTTEEQEEIEIKANTGLKGYKVTISLPNNQLRTYLILVDENLQYIIFSQSTDKSETELIKILEGIGKGAGLLNYDEFYNTFFTLPDKLPDNDRFTAFTLNRLEANYAKNKAYTRWAREMVGHWQAAGYFRNEQKGTWSYSIFDLLTEEEQNYIYKTLYWKEQSKNKQIIMVCGTKGIHVTSRRFNWKKFKTIHTTMEINFGVGRYVCAIDNSEKSWLSKEDLKERAEALQLDNKTSQKEFDEPIL